MTCHRGVTVTVTLAPGAYPLDVSLSDGRAFVARLVVLANRRKQFLELDYSRAD